MISVSARLVVVAVCAFLAGCASTPKAVLAQRALANELLRRGEWQAAFDIVAPLCRERPDDGEALMIRGIIYTEQHMWEEARGDLEDAVRLAPRLVKAHSSLAIVNDLQGRPEEALKHHRIAVKLAPRDPAYLNNLGFSLFVNGRPRDAVTVLNQALREAPGDVKVRNNLAFAYAAAGDFARAEAQFARAGTPAEVKNNLGWAYERRGDLKQAYLAYSEALALDPTSSVARENLARVARTVVIPAAPPENVEAGPKS